MNDDAAVLKKNKLRRLMKVCGLVKLQDQPTVLRPAVMSGGGNCSMAGGVQPSRRGLRVG